MKIIKIPLNAGALNKKKGIEKAPDLIINELKNFYLKENGLMPFFEHEEIKIKNEDIEFSNNLIYNHIRSISSNALLIGGDHSLTFSSFKAFASSNNNPGLIVFDAHLDCENDFIPPTHEDYLRVLIEKKIVKKENVILIGVRNFHSNELEYWKKNKLKVYTMQELSQDGKIEIADAIMSVARNFGKIYVSIDIDVLDPAFAPGTGYLEPGGLTTRELIFFIHKLKNLKNIGMWDIVEVNPEKDINNLTILTAAKLCIEIS